MSTSADGLQPIVQAEHINENIDAKRVGLYGYDSSSQVWKRLAVDGNGNVNTDVPLATRIDDTADPIIYIGKAAIGSATSSAVWQIAKLDASSGLVKTWADGDASFNNVWDNRATTITYS